MSSRDSHSVYVDEEGKVVNVRKIGASDEGVLYTMQISVSNLELLYCAYDVLKLLSCSHSLTGCLLIVIPAQEVPS